MTQVEAMKALISLNVAGFTTRDAGALLNVTSANAGMILRRLARHGFLLHLARGRWAITKKVSRFEIPELLAAPEPAYVSLQSALFHHGLIEQIPAVIYAVTPGRTRRVDTPLGTVSFHRIPPELFTGFEVDAANGAKIATGEKALFDSLYLGPARSRLFARLPEIEFPRTFDWRQLQRYSEGVNSESRRTYLVRRIAALRSQQRRLAGLGREKYGRLASFGGTERALKPVHRRRLRPSR
jgi:predicted transcriptional regulator of viral defense system